MVGIQHEGMARRERKRVFILLLRKNLIRGTELFDDGRIQAHALFQLRCYQQPFTLCLGKLRLHVPLAPDCQGIGGHIPAVGSKHTGNGVPESGLAVAALAVGNDQCLQIDSAHRRHAHNLLYIVDQPPVLAENRVQGIHPQFLSLLSGACRRDLRDIVLRAVVTPALQSVRQVIGSIRRVQEEPIPVQVGYADLQHRLCRLQRRHHIFHVPPLHHKRLIRLGRHIRKVGIHLPGCNLLLQRLPSRGNGVLGNPCAQERLLCPLYLVLRVRKL